MQVEGGRGMTSYYSLRGRPGGSFNYGNAVFGQKWEVFWSFLSSVFCLSGSIFVGPCSSLFFTVSVSVRSGLYNGNFYFLGNLFHLRVLVLSYILCGDRPSSGGSDPHASSWLPPAVTQRRGSLTMYLRVLRSCATGSFSLFTILAATSFCDRGSRFRFLLRGPGSVGR